MGLSEAEIAEVIYHASGYAGFPAANTACRIAREVLTWPLTRRGTANCHNLRASRVQTRSLARKKRNLSHLGESNS
ncbi:carboxymuconolactone decarboxylase family protein [Mycobacterium sp. NPDC048908]|uniref:carboxymuconolactone decarboxylase family protein n=1 Tax=Mycobacterium sp. NPDC048908 TaxID=3364292 RepID=UPI0037199FDB